VIHSNVSSDSWCSRVLRMNVTIESTQWDCERNVYKRWVWLRICIKYIPILSDVHTDWWAIRGHTDWYRCTHQLEATLLDFERCTDRFWAMYIPILSDVHTDFVFISIDTYMYVYVCLVTKREASWPILMGSSKELDSSPRPYIHLLVRNCQLMISYECKYNLTGTIILDGTDLWPILMGSSKELDSSPGPYIQFTSKEMSINDLLCIIL
jgi:hypothetical protein